MNGRENLTCGFCLQPFDSSARAPHMISKCGHSICRSCIEDLSPHGLFQCVECQVSFELPNKKETFPPNHGLLTIIRMNEEGQSKDSSGDDCRVHGHRKLIMCIDPCQKKICYECGLFGEHKNHKMMPESQFFEKASEVYKGLKDNQNEIVQLENFIKNKFIFSNVKDAIVVKKSEVQSEIDDYFREALEQISQLHATLNSEINRKFLELEEKVTNKAAYVFDFWDQVHAWKEKVSNILNESSDVSKDLAKSIFLMTSDTIKNLSFQGKNFVSQIAGGTDSIERMIEDSVSEIKIEKRKINYSNLVSLSFPKIELDSFVSNLESMKNSLILSNRVEKHPGSPTFFDNRTVDTQPKGNLINFKKAYPRISELSDKTPQVLYQTATAQKERETRRYSSNESNSESKKASLNWNMNNPAGMEKTNSLASNKIKYKANMNSFYQKTQPSNQTENSTSGSKNPTPEFKKLPSKTSFIKETPIKPEQFESAKIERLSNRSPQNGTSETRHRSTSKLGTIVASRNSLTPQESESPSKIKKKSATSIQINQDIEPKQSNLNKLLKGTFGQTIKDLGKNKLALFDVSGGDLRDSDILAISNFLYMAKNLRVIKLAKNRLTDEGVKLLCQAIVNNPVHTLDLSSNYATSEGLMSLLNLAKTGGKLKLVNFKKNSFDVKLKEKLVAEFKNYGVALEL